MGGIIAPTEESRRGVRNENHEEITKEKLQWRITDLRRKWQKVTIQWNKCGGNKRAHGEDHKETHKKEDQMKMRERRRRLNEGKGRA